MEKLAVSVWLKSSRKWASVTEGRVSYGDDAKAPFAPMESAGALVNAGVEANEGERVGIRAGEGVELLVGAGNARVEGDGKGV